MPHERSEGIRQRHGKAEEEGLASSTQFKLSSDGDRSKDHPGGEAHTPFIQTVRIVGLALYFLGSCLSMHVSQFVGAPLFFYDMEWYYAWMALIKQHFALLLVTMQQRWSPATLRVSGDESVRGQLTQLSDGRLQSDFPERLVLISNHQIYTDWIYLWWAAYTARMHGHIFIILKDSLKYIPMAGPGMMFFSFIFLSRNWAQDRPRFKHRLDVLKRGKPGERAPMWLLLFPEGTNLSKNGRAKSAAWSKKQNIPDMKHALLPRSTGLHFCIDELADTVEWVYDCTLSYEGVPRGEYGQDVFPLRAIYLQGRAPRSVSMYWRRFAVKDLPKDQAEFDKWTLQCWREKDELLEYFAEHGCFPPNADAGSTYNPAHNGAGITTLSTQPDYIETELKSSSPFEILQIYVPLSALILILSIIRRLWSWLLVALYIRSK